MSCKITIELDGQTEQALLPVIHQVASRYPTLLAGEDGNRYTENTALQQQQIQQLVIQNRLLQEKLAGSSKAQLPAAQVRALPPVNPSAPSQQPTLPARYQIGQVARSVYRLKRLGIGGWRLLVWLCFGREWLLIFLILSGAMLWALTAMPKVSQRLFLLAPEFVDSSDSGPGATVSSEDNKSEESAEAQSEESASPATTAPADPSSKAGSNPPPPPAFKTQQ